jgi:O-succinylbenzoic acid--CoA ligase
MDPTSLMQQEFWNDPAPCAAGRFIGAIPDLAELQSQVLFETSGSSGTPKWIALSKDALRVSADAVNAHLEVTTNSCWGFALPIHHVGGFGIAARAFAANCRFEHFAPRWQPETFTRWITDFQITHTSLVPTQVHDLVAGQHRAPQCLRAVVVGGGRLDEATGRAARALGWPVLASYGMTEAASQIATQSLAALVAPYQSAPIPVLPIWQTKLGDDDQLLIAGPALFSGTLIMHDKAWTYHPRNSPWHETRDRVMLDTQGITPLGRIDAMVKVLGELIDPQSIEHEIIALSEGKLAPQKVAVIAIADPRSEHALVPVFDASVDRELMRQILESYAKNAPGPRRLHEPIILNPLPLSALGKPLRAEILRMVSSQDSGRNGH